MKPKPDRCPCCGSKAEVNWGRTHVDTWAYVICHNCGLRTRNYHGKTDGDAAGNATEAWNRRVEQPLFTLEG